MRVLRVTSVFETPPAVAVRRCGRFDPIGGMQTHTAALTRHLDRLGVKQTVVTTRPPGTPAEVQLGERSVVQRVGLPVPWCRQGFTVAAMSLVRAHLDGHDLVHLHVGEDPGVLALARALTSSGVPVVLTVHSSLRHTVTAAGLRSRAMKLLGGATEVAVKRRVDAVITLTRRAAHLAVADGADPDRVHVIPSGYDDCLFSDVRRDPRIARPGQRVVGYLGRLHHQKDVDTLLRAAKRLPARTAVVIVGDGPDRPRLELQTAELRVTDRVRFFGAVPHDEVPGVLAAFDVLAVPSRYEELGSVAIEAMRSGVPVVAARTGGLAEAVEHGRTGYLVSPGNPVDLARALDHVVHDVPVRASLARHSRERAAQYAWSRLAERVLDVYTGVLPLMPYEATTPVGRRAEELAPV